MEFEKKEEIKFNPTMKLVRDKLRPINDLELLLLKGHILIEYTLNNVLDSMGSMDVKIGDKKFTFDDKITLVELVGFGLKKHHSDLLEQIRTINRVRNTIAHTMDFDKESLHNIYKYHRDEMNEIEKDHNNKDEKEREKLRYVLGYICGAIMGALAVHINLHNRIVNEVPVQRLNEIGQELTHFTNKELLKRAQSEGQDVD